MLGEENVKLQSTSGISNFCPKIPNTSFMNFKEHGFKVQIPVLQFRQFFLGYMIP